MRSIPFFCCAALAFAQFGTEPKPKAEDYESHATAKNAAIGAEFMVHSFSSEGQTYLAKDYLVVEVALYPPKGATLEVNESAFAVRVNGSKKTIAPTPPTAVAFALQHPDWQTGPRLEGGVGMGPADVILGRPRPAPVPGGQQPRMPRPPRAPDPDPPGGIPRERAMRADELAVKAALPEGPYHGPISGFLYFAYKGKTTSIKSLELLYDDAVVKLR